MTSEAHPAIPELLQLASEASRKSQSEKASIEAAKAKIGELESKIKTLLELDAPLPEDPEDPNNPTIVIGKDGKKHLTDEFFRKMAGDRDRMFALTRVKFGVPVGDNETVDVSVSRGERSN